MAGEKLAQDGNGDKTAWDELMEMPDFGTEAPQNVAEKSQDMVEMPQNVAEKPQNAAERLRGVAEKKVDEITERFDTIMAMNRKTVEGTRGRIEKIDDKLVTETDGRRRELFTQQKRNMERILRTQESLVDFARLPTVEDVEYRMRAGKEFAGAVKEAVPDELPVVFHGSNNIGVVKQIIQTHGLKTPEQRGGDMTSFATQIDVTVKTNIKTSCRFAESGMYWMPYGAIFAFMPKPEEMVVVRKTEENGSSEVYGGVDGVDFYEEPERLLGIITTPENIDRVQEWCRESELDENKVMTHGDFLESMSDVDVGDKERS